MFTIKRSKYLNCCCPKRKRVTEEDANAPHKGDDADPKYNFTCGFDGLFNKWCAGTKRHEWPLRCGNHKTLENAGMHIVIKNYWWFDENI